MTDNQTFEFTQWVAGHRTEIQANIDEAVDWVTVECDRYQASSAEQSADAFEAYVRARCAADPEVDDLLKIASIWKIVLTELDADGAARITGDLLGRAKVSTSTELLERLGVPLHDKGEASDDGAAD